MHLRDSTAQVPFKTVLFRELAQGGRRTVNGGIEDKLLLLLAMQQLAKQTSTRRSILDTDCHAVRDTVAARPGTFSCATGLLSP